MFSNKENKFVRGVGWISRSVVSIVMIIHNEHVLCVKRGENVTQTGKWCMPCGYLDYDETIEECAYREVYEETGLYLIDVEEIELMEINSDPSSSKKQNIHFHYRMFASEEYSVDVSKVDQGEVIAIEWVHKNDLDKYDFAFNHDTRIAEQFGI